METRQAKVLLVVPFGASVLLFRGPLIRTLADTGWQVVVAAPDLAEEPRKVLQALGVEVRSYHLERAGINPVSDLRTVVDLYRSIQALRPDLVLTFQPKPNVYGILAAVLSRVPRRAAVVEGLGFAFTEGRATLKKGLVRGVLKALYRLSFALAHKVFFLNPDDLEEFVRPGLVQREKAVLLGGIGVPLEEWPPAPPHLEPITFTLIARLLREKGVREFAEAARRLKARHRGARFWLIGPLDTNPGAISEAEVRSWVTEGLLDWVPWAQDVRPYLRETSVYVLPSYREGVPRSTQEALAMARPVITTDTPGCRETVVPGVNGFLVPPRDPVATAEAMERFVREPGLIPRMGEASRRLAAERFDARKVNERLLRELGL